MTNTNSVQRQYNLDYLRVFASVAVVLLHVTAQNMCYVELAGTEWNIYNMCNGATRWAVPVFVMISGALFLPREISVKDLFKKYILRMATAYAVWSAFYTVIDVSDKLIFEDGNGITVASVAGKFISGEVHLWYLPMIIGIYMCIPLIKQMTANDKLTRYFLVLSLVFCFVGTQIQLITNNLLNGDVQIIFENITTVFKNFNVNVVVGYAVYFVLGYYLNKADIGKKHRLVIYILGVTGLALTIILNLLASVNAGKSTEAFYGASTVNVLMMSVAVFVWFRYNAHGTERLNRIIAHLSKYSFGAYLVHIFILQCLHTAGIQSTTFHPVLSVPSITAFTVAVSYLISMILNKIPVIKKYIV